MGDFRLLKKGAEAYIYVGTYWGMDAVKKKRPPKSYRIKALDQRLRERRSSIEAKLLFEAKKVGVPTPLVMAIWPEEYTIVMEYIPGKLLRDFLMAPEIEKRKKLRYMKQLGAFIGKLHTQDIIHGDLTTSNVIVSPKGHLFLIDFGLGGFSSEIERKGEEIRVLQGSLLSVHYDMFERYLTYFKEGYRDTADIAEKTIKRVEEIAKRGRYISSRNPK